MKPRLWTVAVWTILLGVGGAQMVCDAFGWRALGKLALATGLSPAPRAFSLEQGFEVFSSHARLEWTDGAGEVRTLVFGPELRRRIAGPFGRRQVYGALLGSGPVLRQDAPELFAQVARHALCGDRPLLVELLGPVEVVGPVRILVEPAPGTHGGDLELVLEVRCP